MHTIFGQLESLQNASPQTSGKQIPPRASPVQRESFRGALHLALAFALVKFTLHLFANLWQAHIGWGYFTDEMYYIACSKRLDWAYVDHGPIVALQARLALLLFGRSLAGIRVFTAAAGALTLALTGILAWQLGARRAGQALAMSTMLLSLQFLSSDGFLSMVSFEPLFWLTAVFALVQLLQGGGYRWWVLFGLAAGIGCENKPSMVFFLLALLLGLLVTRQRRVLASPGVLLATGIALLLVLPNLLWQVHHDWATYHFLHNATLARRSSIRLFLPAQALLIGGVTVPMVLAGLFWLLRAPRAQEFRFLGFTYVFFLFLMMGLRAKDYYLTPVYPLMFAAGGVALEAFARARAGSQTRRWLVGAYVVPMLVAELIFVPLTLLLLSPQAMLRLTDFAHVSRRFTLGGNAIPVYYPLRFGWQELTDTVTRVYRSLPASEQAQAGIFCIDWNTASAIQFLGEGRGLPPVTSGHNNYFLWGPQGATGAVMIVVSRATRAQLLREYRQVQVVGEMNHPYALHEHTTIYLCHGRFRPLSEDWPSEKQYY